MPPCMCCMDLLWLRGAVVGEERTRAVSAAGHARCCCCIDASVSGLGQPGVRFLSLLGAAAVHPHRRRR